MISPSPRQHHTLKKPALAALLAALALAPSAQAASRTAPASVTIFRPLNISTTAQLSFGKLQYNGNGPATSNVVLSSAPPITRTSADVQLLPGGSETPAIRTIAGEPSRIYRVTVPTSMVIPGLTVVSFTVWSTNSGNITATHLGQLNASGADTVRIGATLVVPKGTKTATYAVNPTITISYE